MNTENLNKENFWNDLHSKYPEAVQEFCEWIDQYKAENNWRKLFNAMPEDAPKFHDLPIAMQTGIWFEFVQQRGGCDYEIELFGLDIREEITGYIKMMQEQLTDYSR